jgi:hypothetical protein
MWNSSTELTETNSAFASSIDDAIAQDNSKNWLIDLFVDSL